MNRREFISALAAIPFVAESTSMPIIDSHIHLFDNNRPEGSPFPGPNSPLGQSALPSRYREVVKPFGVVGAIVIEAQIGSPRIEDNQWVLDQAAKDTIIVGTVGRLDQNRQISPRIGAVPKEQTVFGNSPKQIAPALEKPQVLYQI